MIQFDLPKQKSSIIKVLGVGGGGSNAVNFMFHQDIESVDFIICNTDSKAIEQSPVPNKIQLGPHLTQGLGAGADPSIGKLATEESLEEIKRILEVNTKMAFITVGMGGGTGTGGAPIIAKICKDLGILTVGIVTTPFGFEGPRRQKQAQEGINQLKPLVDTLLVISNDKLRLQYGNLKMKEAFAKADNVLATAAKCITDVINSRGHIIVDFADVCTVMKNGGVAILGKAEVAGENRAQRAIEEALSSPLLNDNDIKGAKWILLNINSAEGEFECSMDELENISSILRARTGEHSDIIMGSGYDASLGEKIGITLIATGFEGKDPFKKEEVKKEPVPLEEKIVMTLATAEKSTSTIESEPTIEREPTIESEITIESESTLKSEPTSELENLKEASIELIEMPEVEITLNETAQIELIEKGEMFQLNMEEAEQAPVFQFNNELTNELNNGFVLQKPSNIYVEAGQAVGNENKEAIEEKMSITVLPVELSTEPVENFESSFRVVEEEATALELVIREEKIEKGISEEQMISPKNAEIPLDDTEEQRRKVRERIQKLRNLSFNIGNGSDPSAEFDEVPAYIRRNMDLFGNTLASVENYYSKYTVDQDENKQGQISTMNSFLNGKKPD